MEKQEKILRRYMRGAVGVAALGVIEASYAQNAWHMLGGLFVAGTVFTVGCFHELTHGDAPVEATADVAADIVPPETRRQRPPVRRPA